MGGGRWSADTYRGEEKKRIAKGVSAFEYSDRIKEKPRNEQKVHQRLNPSGTMRESRDSDEHPNSVAVSVIFDITGSMRDIPEEVQKNLLTLNGFIEDSGVQDVQIMFGAVGDYEQGDIASLQIGQFESNNEKDKDLGSIFLEGGGGTGPEESYLLAMYYLAYHTDLDCVNKRGHRGYAFILADEMSRTKLSKEAIRDVIGAEVQADVPAEQIIADLLKKYEVFILFPSEGSGYSSRTEHQDHWKQLFPGHFILVAPDEVPETIAAVIASREGSSSSNEINQFLNSGTSGTSVQQVLAELDENTGVVSVDGNLPGLG